MKNKIKFNIVAIFFLFIFTNQVNAFTLTYNFTGIAIDDGRFHAAKPQDTIEGTFSFDSSAFTDLESSYKSEQEYPLTDITFTWHKLRDEILYDHTIYTKPIIESTYYYDFRLVTNSSNSAITYYNLTSDNAFYMGAWMNFTIRFEGEIQEESDILNFPITEVDFQYRTSSTNGFVHAYFNDINITQNNDTSPVVPEPSSFILFISFLLGSFSFFRKKNNI